MFTGLQLKRKPTPPVPKSLVDLAADFLCNVLVDCVLSGDNHPKKSNSTPWTDPKWTQFKEWLAKAPLHLQQMLCANLFAAPAISSILSKPTRPHSTLVTLSLAPTLKARGASGKDLFLLWWLFLDLETTESLPIPSHELDGNFFLQQVTLFSRTPTKLTHLSMAFNWIVRKDFERSLRNLPRLRHVTLQGSFSNELFELLADCNCQLSTLEARGITSGRVTPQAMVKLIESKSAFLSSMDLCQFEERLDFGSASVQGRASVMRALATCKNLVGLALPGDYIRYGDEVPIMESIRELSVHFQGVHPDPLADAQVLVSVVSRFPSLSQLQIHNVTLLGNAEEVLTPLLDKITVFSGSSSSFNMLRFLASLSNIKDFYLKCHSTYLAPPEAVAWKCHLPHLRFLHVKDSFAHCRFKDLKQILLGAPKLQHVSLQCRTVPDYDESDFIESIQRAKDAFCDLKFLRFTINYGSDAATVSENLVVKILERASDLEFLSTFIRRSLPLVNDSLIRVALEKRFDISINTLPSN